MDELNSLYQSLLKTAWFVPDPDGWVRTIDRPDAPSKQITLGGQPLVLPTQDQLMKPSGKVFFHPLAEDVVQGESPVLAKLRHGLSLRINATIAGLIGELVVLSMSPAEHSKLTPRQSEVLSVLKTINDAGAQKLRALIDAAERKFGQHGMLYSMYVAQRGKFKGNVHSRVGIASFPLYEELKKTDRPFDIEVSKTHHKAFVEMFEWLIPGIGDTEAYNYASDSTVAPRLEAVYGAYAQIASLLNEVIEKYEGYLADKINLEDYRLPVHWSEHLGHFDDLRRITQLVPAQPASAGSEKRADVLAREQAIQTPQPAATAAPAHTNPHDTPPWDPVPGPIATQPPAGVKNKGTDFYQALRESQSRPQNQQQMPASMYGQPQPMRPSAPVNPHDFQALAAQEALRTGRAVGQAYDNYGRPIVQTAPVYGVGNYSNGI